MWVVVLFVVLFSLLLDFAFLGKFIITYQLTEDYFNIYFLKFIPMVKIDIASIKKIEKLNLYQRLTAGLPTLFRSHVFTTHLRLTVSGMSPKEYLITPDDPDKFIQEIKTRVKEKTGKDI